MLILEMWSGVRLVIQAFTSGMKKKRANQAHGKYKKKNKQKPKWK